MKKKKYKNYSSKFKVLDFRGASEGDWTDKEVCEYIGGGGSEVGGWRSK